MSNNLETITDSHFIVLHRGMNIVVHFRLDSELETLVAACGPKVSDTQFDRQLVLYLGDVTKPKDTVLDWMDYQGTMRKLNEGFQAKFGAFEGNEEEGEWWQTVIKFLMANLVFNSDSGFSLK